MIEPLRRRHRWMIATVTFVVVPLFFAALMVRPKRPLEENLGGRFEMATPEAGPERTLELLTKPPVEIAIDTGGRTITVTALESVEIPGLLLYWQPRATEFPAGALLIGALRGHGRQTLALPEVGPVGTLVLYSLGHGEELARVGWPGGATP